MEDWIRQFEKLLKSMGIKVHLLVKYVDDVVAITSNCQLGTRFKDGKLVQSEEDCLMDLEQGRTRSQVTLDILREAANSITRYLKFTGEASVRGS